MPSPNLQMLKGWLSFLVPVSWAFLIVRLVQDENLVGDRQFWLTRPYDWKKLLAEKILFVLAALILPLFIAQLVLLRMAGFRPAAYLPALLLLALLWLLYLVLPAITLAAITSSVGQAVAVVLGVIACFVAIGIALAERTGSSSLARQQSFANSLPVVVGFAAAAAVVIWQYARRRTLKARLVLIAAIIIAAFVLPPLIPDKNIASAYPSTNGQAAPVQLAFDDQTHDVGFALQQKKTVTVRLPLLVSGIAGGSVVYIDGAMLAVRAPDGRNWRSGWQGGGRLFSNYKRTFIDFQIPRPFFDAVKTTPVNARITFALAVNRESQPVVVAAKAGGFDIPGNGRCSIASTGGVLCLFPLKLPALLIEVPSEGLTCPPPAKANPLPPGLPGYFLTRRSEIPVDFGISPVDTDQIFSWEWDFGEMGDRSSAGGICPGTPLRVGFITEESGTRADLQVNGIRLADYTPRPAPGGGAEDFSVGFSVHLP